VIFTDLLQNIGRSNSVWSGIKSRYGFHREFGDVASCMRQRRSGTQPLSLSTDAFSATLHHYTKLLLVFCTVLYCTVLITLSPVQPYLSAEKCQFYSCPINALRKV